MRAPGTWLLAPVVVVTLAVAACGGGENKDDAPAGDAATAPAAATAAVTPDKARCPLTSAQVTAAVGVPMKGPDWACGFNTLDDKLMPNVLFVLHDPMACQPQMLEVLNLKEKVDGLGVPAYTGTDAEGTHLLTCRTGNGTRPFDIVVDTPDVARSRAIAMTLAKALLES
jgi:hypothetical protein